MDRKSLVTQTVADMFGRVRGVHVLYCISNADADHPLRVRQRNIWRIIISGWTSSYHRAAIHQTITLPKKCADETVEVRIREDLRGMLRTQEARAREGRTRHELEEPLARREFCDEDPHIRVDHLIVPRIAVMHLLAEGGDHCTVRRRVARIANSEIRRREHLKKSPISGTILKGCELRFSLEIGDQATLDDDMLFLRTELPETIIQAKQRFEGDRLDRLVEVDGIGGLAIKRIIHGRAYAKDVRKYARECGMAIQLAGHWRGSLGVLLTQMRDG